MVSESDMHGKAQQVNNDCHNAKYTEENCLLEAELFAQIEGYAMTRP